MSAAPAVLLARLDAAVDGVVLRTLDPTRDRARLPSEAIAPLRGAVEVLGPRALPTLAEGLRALLTAVRLHFPGNIYWDLDRLVAGLVSEAESEAALGEALSEAETLHRMFGGHSAIRFRYVHDFLYGFDWAKWVARDPAARSRVGPFDRAFLAYTQRRGRELLELIARDDAKYHRLRDERPRNPFPFSREPEHERRLHEDLARRGLLPVESWRSDATPRWDLPFAAEREARARALSIPAP
jgi:hypothetical protein